MDSGTAYRIVVRGELDDRFAYLFNGMDMQRADGTTVLTGSVVDQAKLHGLIERLEELALELVSVEQLDRPS
jgi:cell division FtsZ-interacting protein ZapD